MTLSVCMIVKNEESCLRQCLEQVSVFADEMIIVDTGSEDSTRAIALEFTENVYDYQWKDDFSDARNFAFSLGTSDYLMSVDADERFRKEEIQKILEYKKQITGDVICLVCERPEFQTRALQARIVRRNKGPYWRGRIHEHLILSGTVIQWPITFIHQKQRKPDYRRNCSLIEKLPPSDLKENFWLCAQCWMDLVLAEESERAGVLFQYLWENEEPYEEKRDTILLVTQGLKTCGKKKEAARLLYLSLQELQKQYRRSKGES